MQATGKYRQEKGGRWMKDTCRRMWKSVKTYARMWLAGFLLVIMCLNGITVFAADIPNHTEDFYVNDYAGIFSDEQRDRIGI